MEFQYFLPTKIVVKPGVSSNIGEYLKDIETSNVLVITDKGIKQAGLLNSIYESLNTHHISFDEYADVTSNPRDKECNRAIELFGNKKLDGILAVGGGSVIDTAKAVSILYTNGGIIKDYEGMNVATHNPLPIVCIPTTAGTGSEVTLWSVVTDTTNQYKMGIGDDRIIPKLALLDAKLISSLPPSIAASTGMDALTHAIEAYTCTIANPISDGLALHAIKLIKENIVAAVHEENSIEASEKMLVASLMAGAAFGNADTAGVHCISEAIGGWYDTPHGVTNAIFLPYLFQYNMEANLQKHAEIGYALGVDYRMSQEQAASEAVTILVNLNEKLGIPSFRQIAQVDTNDFDQLASNAVKSSSNLHNARKMDVADYMKILQQAYEANLK